MRTAAALGAALWLVILGVVFSFNNAQAGNVTTGSIARITGGNIGGNATIKITNNRTRSANESINYATINTLASTNGMAYTGFYLKSNYATTTATGNSGVGMVIGSLRNNDIYSAQDSGTLTEISSARILFGHGSTSAVTPTTTAFTGVKAELFGGTGTITTATAFLATTVSTGATITNQFGFRTDYAAATGRWAVYAGGTAQSAFGGNVRIGSVVAPTVALDVTGAIQASTTIKTGAYTVATLPTCNAGAQGTRAHVTNALAPAWNTALVGGGAVVVGAFCNGAAWVAQ